MVLRKLAGETLSLDSTSLCCLLYSQSGFQFGFPLWVVPPWKCFVDLLGAHCFTPVRSREKQIVVAFTIGFEHVHQSALRLCLVTPSIIRFATQHSGLPV